MKLICGNASDNLYLTFKGGCRKLLEIESCYRCTGCGGRFHKDCILEHFKLEATHDWGRQQERERIAKDIWEDEQKANKALHEMMGNKVLPNSPKYVRMDGRILGLQRARDIAKGKTNAEK